MACVSLIDSPVVNSLLGSSEARFIWLVVDVPSDLATVTFVHVIVVANVIGTSVIIGVADVVCADVVVGTVVVLCTKIIKFRSSIQTISLQRLNMLKLLQHFYSTCSFVYINNEKLS